MITQSMDGIGFELKAPHDFTWIHKYGRVFCAFDNLISGNICFGVTNGQQKYFIKYAGAHTKMYAGQPESAVRHLRDAAGKYEELKHKSVSTLLTTEVTPSGFALVFQWFDGYALAPIELHLNRLQAFHLVDRLRMYDGLVDLIVQANRKDYLAAGLSHQQILINFEESRAIVSSLDHFRRFPLVAPHPKLPGSTWFVPPEGYVVGTPLDERSNVYAQGALAFTFFGNPLKQNEQGWSAGNALYQLAQKAVQEDRENRISSPALYQKLWRETVLKMPRLSGV